MLDNEKSVARGATYRVLCAAVSPAPGSRACPVSGPLVPVPVQQGLAVPTWECGAAGATDRTSLESGTQYQQTEDGPFSRTCTCMQTYYVHVHVHVHDFYT